jgi:hypothetical protein
MNNSLIPKPAFRVLRGYAFDPSLSLDLDTVTVNEICYTIPWEENLKQGPEGEYIKVIDRDPSSDATYKPVDLNDLRILASDGLTPDVSNPQFHQQMVYAVVMNTINNFEKAIGRKVIWNKGLANRKENPYGYVQHLAIYPHALRDVNAYYSPERKSLLFGYFNAEPASADLHMPGSLVFSCLSHDIVAHETTHAILDGIFSRYMENTHPDVGGFHEGFSDIVALLQHFTFPESLRQQIAKARGKFNAETLLGQLAVEFGKASGDYGALRDAIGEIDDETGVWKPKTPNVNDYKENFESHDRGAILVAVIFDAFINIYNHRTSDLLRIATNGTGILPNGALNHDLVMRLADEAAKTASQILKMCIRALDYCPPVDINYGDYLRALITADADLVNNDDRNYRIAFINAFRKWGIYPENVSILSEESLVYTYESQSEEMEILNSALSEFLKMYRDEISYETDRRKIFDKTHYFITGGRFEGKYYKGFHEYLFGEAVLNQRNNRLFEKLTGLIFTNNYNKLNIATSQAYKNGPAIEIHSIRLNNRVGPDGNLQNQVIITLLQRCGAKVTYNEKTDEYTIKTMPIAVINKKIEKEEDGCFIFRGGCTLIFDLNSNKLKHVISKPIFDVEKNNGNKSVYVPDYNRAVMQYRCSWGDYAELTGFAARRNNLEPIAHLHKPKSDYYG